VCLVFICLVRAFLVGVLRCQDSKLRLLGNYYTNKFLWSSCRGDYNLGLCTTLVLVKTMLLHTLYIRKKLHKGAICTKIEFHPGLGLLGHWFLFDSSRTPENSYPYGFEIIDPQTRVLNYCFQEKEQINQWRSQLAKRKKAWVVTNISISAENQKSKSVYCRPFPRKWD